ncbi:thiol:disulfide interchange protein DsbC [Dyella sp. OK004]|uniref:DsbC family protein n=1 Tax=Dyella sp. OK004 TaxID=1855292 RepID=UPI0008EACE04|nr:DsbC family protein [Dyella sp. OK004]SFS07275.1 thiol:disulfide interchange protein DsbC [Dyella sp. OK004]
MLKKWLLALCASALAFQAFAADVAAPSSAENTVRQAVLGLAKVKIESIKPAPLPGFYQVIASGQLVYVSADGKYMMTGNLIDLASKKDISDSGWAEFRKAELAKVPQADRIVFAPAKPLHTVTVFTDVNCGYCRALHEHVADFNKAGIALEYIAWPREGVNTTAGNPTPTYSEMVSVWCAADRKAAFTAAKSGKKPKETTCTNPVKDEFDLGVRLGVTGTPTIVADDGSVLGGYMTPEQLLKALDKRNKVAGPDKAP